MVLVIGIIFFNSSKSINVLKFLQETKNVLSPFIYGIGIAYVINPILKFIENKILIKSKYISERKSLKRFISISATYIFLISFIFWIVSYLGPEIVNSVQSIVSKLKTFDIEYLEELFTDKISFPEEISAYISVKIQEVLTKTLENVPAIFNTLISGTVNLASILFNAILGIIISIYILIDKENISKFNKKMIYAFTSEKIANNILKFCKDSNDTFEKFFVGKIIDSTIIGIIFFIGASIINPPFVLLLSIIIGVTNMIPFFGPFIGGVPVFLITIISDVANPSKAIWIIIFILALQQFDGNILGPKILGDSIGVKPLGIIFAIIVAGAILGPAGMFFGVPIFAVIFNLFSNFIDKKYREKYK